MNPEIAKLNEDNKMPVDYGLGTNPVVVETALVAWPHLERSQRVWINIRVRRNTV